MQILNSIENRNFGGLNTIWTSQELIKQRIEFSRIESIERKALKINFKSRETVNMFIRNSVYSYSAKNANIQACSYIWHSYRCYNQRNWGECGLCEFPIRNTKTEKENSMC